MKKFISVVLVLVLCFGLIPGSYSAALSAGEQLQDMGLLAGDLYGNLNENQYLTRSEMMVILTRMLGEYEQAYKWTRKSTFSDGAGHWSERYVAYAQYRGWTVGIGNNKFGYDMSHNVQEASVFMLKALGYTAPNDFTWSSAYTKAKQLGLFEGLNLKETDEILRGDLFEVMLNTLSTRVKAQNYTLLDKLEGFTSSYPSGDLEVQWLTTYANEIRIVFSEEMSSGALLSSNYRLDGKALPSGTVLYFSDTNKDEVIIELPDGSIEKTDTYVLTISENILSDDGERLDREHLIQIVDGLIDNTKPFIKSAEKVNNSTILINFNEDLSVFDLSDFIVKVNDNEIEIFGYDFVDDDVIKIFVSDYNTSQTVSVESIEDPDDTIDEAGNVVVGDYKVIAKAAN
ncbi:MAG: hypothetical protein GT601_18460 [Acidaminobacter sp.]|uniref:hypothetical protein n=1 Tax=Acidaminobacter sp. TaxID=1872102 RepID=UPI00137F898B|nr:hypothetical protein [Acidaminobacter sp.]MZQ99654.1 hypothetical protein [Acidaminobacter sp.]